MRQAIFRALNLDMQSPATPEAPSITAQSAEASADCIPREERQRAFLTDAKLHRLVTPLTILGTGVFGGYFLCLIVYHSIWGPVAPANWVTMIMQQHWPAVVGLPMSAIAAFCIVSLLRVTNGPIEFEGLGFKFHGASGPVVLWVLCFLVLVAALSLLWAKSG